MTVTAGTTTDTQVDPNAAISVRGLWKIFGEKAGEVINSPDASLSRPELLEKTGCVAAVRDASFDVGNGEVFVVMNSPDLK